MLNNISRVRLASTWIALVVVAFACSVVGGAAVTMSAGELWFIACVAPPTAMLLVWRGAPAMTVAELLYAVDNPATDARR